MIHNLKDIQPLKLSTTNLFLKFNTKTVIKLFKFVYIKGLNNSIKIKTMNSLFPSSSFGLGGLPKHIYNLEQLTDRRLDTSSIFSQNCVSWKIPVFSVDSSEKKKIINSCRMH